VFGIRALCLDMALTPHKRASGPEWEIRSDKAPKVSCSTGTALPHGATFRVGPQPARRPLADIQQPRQHPMHVSPPNATQWKPSGKQSSSTYQSPCESPLGPRYNKSSSSYAAPTHQQPSRDHDCFPGNLNPPRQAGASHPSLAHSRSAATQIVPWISYKPEVRHNPHPESKLCQNFHWVPYPLGLMPFDSWSKLHHKPEHVQSHSFLCPACLAPRELTPHARKLFLVAERLSREDGNTSMHDKVLNEELIWAVNYELGILDPFVEDPHQIPGGKYSQTNRFHPYANEYEMKLAFKYIFMAGDITELTWSLWIGTQLDLQKMLGDDEKEAFPEKPNLQQDGLKILESKGKTVRPKTREVETIDLTDSPPPRSRGKAPIGLSTLPSSFIIHQQKNHEVTGALPAAQAPKERNDSVTLAPTIPPPFFHQQRRIVSYKTLQDFYGLLDKIERTSYVSAVFLEAYAERLRDDICKTCWLKRNVNLELY
jgi:hypothetical protein